MGISRGTFLICILAAACFLTWLSGGLARFGGPAPEGAPRPFGQAVTETWADWFGGSEPEVLVFSAPGDLDSQELVLRLRREGIPFRERVVDGDPRIQAELLRHAADGYLPTVVINGLAVRGDDTTQLEFSISTYHVREKRRDQDS